jgi:hypothetical protein
MVISKKGGESGRSDLHRLGLFSEAKYISTGEAYKKQNGIACILVATK